MVRTYFEHALGESINNYYKPRSVKNMMMMLRTLIKAAKRVKIVNPAALRSVHVREARIITELVSLWWEIKFEVK